MVLLCINKDKSELVFVYHTVRKMSIPSSVTKIGDYAFYNCTNLSSLTLPSGVKEIGFSAFQGCKSLTSVTIPSGVK